MGIFDDFLVPELQNNPGCNQRTQFQQKKATLQTSQISLPRVREISTGNFMSRKGYINWTLRSPDLSSKDFSLRRCLKSIDNWPSLAQLRGNICQEMTVITEPTWRVVMGNFSDYLYECRESAHIQKTLFLRSKFRSCVFEQLLNILFYMYKSNLNFF